MKILKDWSEFKNWLETKNPNLFKIVWAFGWRWIVIQLVIGAILLIIIKIIELFI